MEKLIKHANGQWELLEKGSATASGSYSLPEKKKKGVEESTQYAGPSPSHQPAEPVQKDNSVKPFGQNIYNPVANIGRKATRTGEVREGAGKNVAVRAISSAPMGSRTAQVNRQARADAKRNKKQPITQISVEQYNKEKQFKKSEELTISPNGQWILK